jgi:hypothetical protein
LLVRLRGPLKSNTQSEENLPRLAARGDGLGPFSGQGIGCEAIRLSTLARLLFGFQLFLGLEENGLTAVRLG